MSPIQVLLVGNFLSSSTGIRSVCEDLAAQLTASGWPILTTSAQPGRLARVQEMVGTVWRERHRYDVAAVEVYSGHAFIWAELVCRSLERLGKPFVLTLHGGNLPVFARRWPGRVRRLLRTAATVTTPSAFLHEEMRPYREDLCLLPNPIDLGAYQARLRTEIRPQLIWLRSFHQMYNPALAPKVVAALIEDFPELHLTMIGPDKGDGSLRETQRAAEELGVTRHLSFPGAIPKSEVPVWLDRHDIFLNTTNVDNMPVSVIEAMACGLCLVSTNVGGLPHLLEQERDALLVPANESDSMAAAIRRLLTDPRLAANLSHHARRKAERFNWAEILPEWKRLLAAATEGTVD
ncbi:MAG TPA: glycosyltransferase family 4 protein [Blastocatellia bacterium]|nr:glycosyltransferase family 4 protein [Blastocatellia bacterium]